MLDTTPSYLQGEHYVFQLLSSEQIRELHELMTAKLAEFPHLAREEIASKVFLDLNLSAIICNKIKGSLFVSLHFGYCVQTYLDRENLPTLSNFTFKTEMLHETTQYVEKIRIEWHTLLSTFRDFMSIHPRFQEFSVSFIRDIENQIVELNGKEICSWGQPTFGDDKMKERSTNLAIAQRSLIYKWEFAKQIKEEETLYVSPDLSAAMEEWKASIDQSFSRWTTIIPQIISGKFPVCDLMEKLLPIVDGCPECPEIPNNEVQARGVISKYSNQVQEHLKQVIREETVATSAIMS